MTGDCVIAVDVGATTLKGGLCDRDATLLHRERRRTERASAEEALDGVAALVSDLADEARRRFGPGGVAGVGLAVPGLVDEARGLVRHAVNMPWRDVPVAELVAARTGLPVVLGHDVRAAAAAEAALGAGRDGGDFLFVAIGTGIGAAIVLDGQPYLGAHGGAGELGHTVVDPDGPPCGCGGRGHLEAIASAAAIERAYAEAGAGDGASAREVATLVQAHDPAAREAWDRAVGALAAGLAGCVTMLDPARIVVGGGLAQAGAQLFEPLEAELGRRLPVGEPPPIVPAALGPDAGCRGAALLAWRALAQRGRLPAAAPGMISAG
jgi:glucokinase